MCIRKIRNVTRIQIFGSSGDGRLWRSIGSDANKICKCRKYRVRRKNWRVLLKRKPSELAITISVVVLRAEIRTAVQGTLRHAPAGSDICFLPRCIHGVYLSKNNFRKQVDLPAALCPRRLLLIRAGRCHFSILNLFDVRRRGKNSLAFAPTRHCHVLA
jgi:hypothetical protein